MDPPERPTLSEIKTEKEPQIVSYHAARFWQQTEKAYRLLFP